MPAVIKHPVNVEGPQMRPAGPAPELGQHSEEILAELVIPRMTLPRSKSRA